MGFAQGVLARYVCGEDVWRWVTELGGDAWVETTDREHVRLRVGVWSPLEGTTSVGVWRGGSFWVRTRRVGVRSCRHRSLTRMRPVPGRAWVGGLWVTQTHTLIQATYLLDTFFSGGLVPARMGLVRSLGLRGGSTWCDYEAGSPVVPLVSLSAQFRAAPWLEREMAEMRDRVFLYHPDARFLLLDYGIQHGHDRQNRLG